MITVDVEDLTKVLAEIEFMLISLDRMGCHYGFLFHDNKGDSELLALKHLEYYRETTSFIDKSLIVPRLNEIRSILGKSLRNDKQAEERLEALVETLNCWSKPGDAFEGDIGSGLMNAKLVRMGGS